MAMKSIRHWLMSAAAVVSLSACTPKATTAPPPQAPVLADSPDGGFPNVPLTKKGVIVPSDVKLEPGPKPEGQPAPGITNATATPNAN
jgi:hypothetical protein